MPTVRPYCKCARCVCESICWGPPLVPLYLCMGFSRVAGLESPAHWRCRLLVWVERGVAVWQNAHARTAGLPLSNKTHTFTLSDSERESESVCVCTMSAIGGGSGRTLPVHSRNDSAVCTERLWGLRLTACPRPLLHSALWVREWGWPPRWVTRPAEWPGAATLSVCPSMCVCPEFCVRFFLFCFCTCLTIACSRQNCICPGERKSPTLPGCCGSWCRRPGLLLSMLTRLCMCVYVFQAAAVQVKLELGHRAQVRKKPTVEGFTHDWMVFVRGPEHSNIQHFVEKVVFHLHDSFPRPKRGKHGQLQKMHFFLFVFCLSTWLPSERRCLNRVHRGLSEFKNKRGSCLLQRVLNIDVFLAVGYSHKRHCDATLSFELLEQPRDWIKNLLTLLFWLH